MSGHYAVTFFKNGVRMGKWPERFPTAQAAVLEVLNQSWLSKIDKWTPADIEARVKEVTVKGYTVFSKWDWATGPEPGWARWVVAVDGTPYNIELVA